MQNRRGAPGPRPPYAQGGYAPPPSYIESPDYLGAGYLDARGNTRPELITSEAERVAKELDRGRLNYSQLRRFFAKIRFIELLLNSRAPFEDVQAHIASLCPASAYAVQRGVAPPAFRVFIEKNVGFAQKSEDNFRKGLLQHFQSIICYFPRQQGQ